MRIYTRAGDQGETSLLGSERVAKSDPRIEVCGNLDETNAALGLARALGLPEAIDALVASVQQDLLVAGAEVAAASKTVPLPWLGNDDVARLEGMIDAHQAELPALSNFIVPGGTPAGAALHCARSVCRRTERSLVRIRGGAPQDSCLLAYLNRLSDLLFVLARHANALAGAAEFRFNPCERRSEG